MRQFAIITVLCAALGLGACGGSADMTCDEVEPYQLAEKRPRVVAPDGLDNLDPLREMPLPEASPRPERPPGSPCLDRPPAVTISN